ncbi:aspartyl beta-hydroxylase [Kiloniella spongiae]|uniref:Aspartyl beta-hydroxylase n=1 Tax=Kiloniella spongiae TaxID=1489064 RepID=A0A0H2MAQ1_9PROT|nr:aspartyl/asparaginyl beta-hydroxylase domain-containing protein [Kiloniella spongiae]KLN59261.1 aspartyl beta-hydroxylase [Kiloniella spongiae]
MSKKQISRLLRVIIPLAILLYFIPLLTIAFIIMGLLDVGRHHQVTADLAKKYFTGNGMLTWALSPINLFLDLISDRNRYVYKLDDFPEGHRNEIASVLKEFDNNKEEIISDIRAQLGGESRGMLFYKWYGKNTNDAVPAFNKEFTYIKTIGVSVFNKKKSTSLHFGPLRLTLRVLYNLTPIKSDNIYIEVDGKKHYWHDDPLFIFDDTIQHQSINEEDHERYCVFVDVLRPSAFTGLQNIFMQIMQTVFINFNGIFYKNWTFLK